LAKEQILEMRKEDMGCDGMDLGKKRTIILIDQQLQKLKTQKSLSQNPINAFPLVAPSYL